MLFVESRTQAAFRVLGSSSVYIISYPHPSERLDLHELRLALMCPQAGADRPFTTADIHNLALGVMKLIYTLTVRSTLDRFLREWVWLAKRHTAIIELDKKPCQ